MSEGISNRRLKFFCYVMLYGFYTLSLNCTRRLMYNLSTERSRRLSRYQVQGILMNYVVIVVWNYKKTLSFYLYYLCIIFFKDLYFVFLTFHIYDFHYPNHLSLCNFNCMIFMWYSPLPSPCPFRYFGCDHLVCHQMTMQTISLHEISSAKTGDAYLVYYY